MTFVAKTLVFDLDGTLVHSAPDLHAALNLALREFGRDDVTLHQVTQMIGDGVALLVERGFDASGGPAPDPAAALALFLEYYERDPSTHTTLYPGVIETLEHLGNAGYRMAVCTNKPLEPARAVLDAYGLSAFFAAVSGGDTFPVRKPSPGHLLGTLAMMDADPAKAVMIGDSPNDVHVALNAAIPAIAVSYGYRRIPAEELGADILINRFDEIPTALQQLGL